MSWLTPLLIAIQVLCAVAIIVLVLLQHGKGADMGAAFGSGASGSLFGATGAANFLSRSTAMDGSSSPFSPPRPRASSGSGPRWAGRAWSCLCGAPIFFAIRRAFRRLDGIGC